MRAIVSSLLAATLAAGCHKPRPAAPPAPRPASLIVDLARPSEASWDGVRTLVGSVKPKAAAMIGDAIIVGEAANQVGMKTMDGLDRSAPVHLLVLEHPKDDAGLVLVAKVGDAAKLQAGKGTATVEIRNGWAAIGAPAFVHEAAPYALTALATAPPPAALTAIVYLPRILEDHADDLDRALRALPSLPGWNGNTWWMVGDQVTGLLSVARDTDELRVTLDASAGRALFDVVLRPHPRTRLAEFVAQQRPDDFHMIAALPPDATGFVAGGRIAAGPYHLALLSTWAKLYQTAAELGPLFEAVAEPMTGEFAIGSRSDAQHGLGYIELFGLADSGRASAALDQVHDAFGTGTSQIGAVRATYRALPDAAEHDGVAVQRAEMHYDASHDAPDQQRMYARIAPSGVQRIAGAAFDHELALATAEDATDEVARAIDVARGKTPGLALPQAKAALVAAARARKDSAVMIFDGRMFMGLDPPLEDTTAAPLALAIGTQDGVLHLRVTIPAKTVAALATH